MDVEKLTGEIKDRYVKCQNVGFHNVQQEQKEQDICLCTFP